MEDKKDPMSQLIEDYEDYLIPSFNELWGLVDIEYNKLEAYSVIGGMLSRQVTLSIQMVRSPNMLNGHSAPLFLRAMTDLHIALAWIMLDLEERSNKYIMHGLGEEKLSIEHFKKGVEDDPDNPNNEQIEQLIEAKSAWINAQRRDLFVEVNLGNWSQLDYRKMSQEADCESLYKYAYKPFSVAAHNMWPHISNYNCKTCTNPLHKYHLLPELLEVPPDLDYLYRSCKYVDKAFVLFIDKFDLKYKSLLPLEWWDEYFTEDEINNENDDSDNET
jgi:hypothetical protein